MKQCTKCGLVNTLDKFTPAADDQHQCPSCRHVDLLMDYTVNQLDYDYIKPGEKPHDNKTFRIQASQISKFFDYTNSWYREKLLNESGFSGNTASVLGTALHWAAENYIKHQSLSQPVKDEMYSYVSEQAKKHPDAVEEPKILEQLTPMWKATREYINENPGGLVEPFAELEILPGITVGGSIDRVLPVGDNQIYTSLEQLRGRSVEIQDWKSSSAKTISERSMTKGYEWQMLVYAYALKKLYDINVIQITDVFITKYIDGGVSPKTGKALKSYYPTVTPISKPVTQDSLLFIESIINVVAHSVQKFVQDPSSRYLLAQDYRLKDHKEMLPFTNIINQSTNEEI